MSHQIRRLSLRGIALPLAGTLVFTAVSAQPTQHDYRFEVASIRPGDPDGRVAGTPGPAFTPGRYRLESNSLWGLADIAFNRRHPFELVCPDWMIHAHFTIDATVPEGATKNDVPMMMLHLLEDRFALKYHHETRQLEGYELVVAKSGPKLQKSAGPPDASAVKGDGFEIKDGVPQFDKNSGHQQVYVGTPAGSVTWWRGRDEPMRRLASDISEGINTPVVDATGLTEKYDFLLNFIEENASANSSGALTTSDYPPLREALKEQLGLELRPSKNVPVDVIVIDSANKQPTDN